MFSCRKKDDIQDDIITIELVLQEKDEYIEKEFERSACCGGKIYRIWRVPEEPNLRGCVIATPETLTAACGFHDGCQHYLLQFIYQQALAYLCSKQNIIRKIINIEGKNKG